MSSHPKTTTSNLTLNRWHAEREIIPTNLQTIRFYFGLHLLHFRDASGQCVWVFRISHMGDRGDKNCNILMATVSRRRINLKCMCVCVCVHGRRCVVTISRSVFRGTVLVCLRLASVICALCWTCSKRNQTSNVTKVSYWKSFIENLMYPCTVSAPNIYTPIGFPKG